MDMQERTLHLTFNAVHAGDAKICDENSEDSGRNSKNSLEKDLGGEAATSPGSQAEAALFGCSPPITEGDTAMLPLHPIYIHKYLPLYPAGRLWYWAFSSLLQRDHGPFSGRPDNC